MFRFEVFTEQSNLSRMGMIAFLHHKKEGLVGVLMGSRVPTVACQSLGKTPINLPMARSTQTLVLGDCVLEVIGRRLEIAHFKEKFTP